jgi:hypothetical protein
MVRVRWLDGADQDSRSLKVFCGVGSCLSPAIDPCAWSVVDTNAKLQPWDLVCVEMPDGDHLVKQVAQHGSGDRVLLSNLPPLKLVRGMRIVGKVVCIVEPRGLLRRILRWCFSDELAEADRDSAEYVAICRERVRAAHGVENPCFALWQPERLRWA